MNLFLHFSEPLTILFGWSLRVSPAMRPILELEVSGLGLQPTLSTYPDWLTDLCTNLLNRVTNVNVWFLKSVSLSLSVASNADLIHVFI